MRTCLILMMAIGCGDSGETPVKDLSVAVKKDLSGLNTSCDLVKQDCPSGKKCVGMFDGTNWNGTCIANGSVAAGGACMPGMSMDTLDDNCVAGYACDNIYGSLSNTCHKICGQDSDCASDERCGDFLFARAGWGWCAKTCTPFSTATGNCPANMDCGETADDALQPDPQNTEVGFFVCKMTGAGGPYAVCNGDQDCGVGLWCGYIDMNQTVAECLPNCSDTNACTVPNPDAGVAMVACFPLTSQPDNAGYCLPQ